MRSVDVLVAGAGGMGTSIAYHLAKAGVKTVVLDRFSLNHQNGSSHGKTRIIRLAYAEHPSYVPILKRAYELWFSLQKETGEDLIRMNGGLMCGRPDSWVVSGALESARMYSLPYRMLSKREVQERFPPFRLSEDQVALFEPNAGILFPEKIMETHYRLAVGDGAEFRFNEPLTRWEPTNEGIRAESTLETYSAKKIVFASGPWTKRLLPGLELPLRVERQVVFWFRPSRHEALFGVDRMPIFMFEEGARGLFYGIPDVGGGVKAAMHHGGEMTEPDDVRRGISVEDELPVKGFLSRHMPWLDGPPVDSNTCLYTNSPDRDFVLDFHPKRSDVVIASVCSGHGFKFTGVVGEIVSEMVMSGRTSLDVSLFRIDRFNLH